MTATEALKHEWLAEVAPKKDAPVIAAGERIGKMQAVRRAESKLTTREVSFLNEDDADDKSD